MFGIADRTVANAVPDIRRLAIDVIEANTEDNVARFIRNDWAEEAPSRGRAPDVGGGWKMGQHLGAESFDLAAQYTRRYAEGTSTD